MLYRTIMRMIERKQTEGLAEKVDIFFARGKLTEEEYQKISTLLSETA